MLFYPLKCNAMKNKLLLLILFAALPLFAQTRTEEIISTKLNATRDITITFPQYYEEDKGKVYPLLLVLDGEYLVEPFKGIMQYANYWDDLPEAIIVGINMNEDRQREEDTRISETTGLPEGSSNQFYEFISSELLPYLQKKYRISPFKVIAGHDATAGFLNFFLYKQDPLFTGFICFSPTLAPDMETQVPTMLEQAKRPVFFYMATSDGDVEKMQKRIMTFDTNLKAVKNPNLRYFFEKFGDVSHYSLVPYGAPGALYSMFSSYKPISSIEYRDKIVTLKSGYVDYLKEKYQIIEKDLGVKMTVRINDIKAVEAAIMKNTMYDELRDLADLAKKNYPKMIIGEYYDGLYYEMTGNLKKAKKVYLNSYTYKSVGDYTKDFMITRAEGLNVD